MSSPEESTPQDDSRLREALKRCSSATYYAACKFQQSGRAEDLKTVIVGVIERFVDRALRPKLAAAADSLRLREDLALDSLTMMEVVMIAEDVLAISVTNEELTRLHTVGDVHAFFLAKLKSAGAGTSARPTSKDDGAWDLPAVASQVRQLEANGHAPAPGLSIHPARQ